MKIQTISVRLLRAMFSGMYWVGIATWLMFSGIVLMVVVARLVEAGLLALGTPLPIVDLAIFLVPALILVVALIPILDRSIPNKGE